MQLLNLNFLGLAFPFSLHGFRDLDSNISEESFKELIGRLLSQQKKTSEDPEEDPNTPSTATLSRDSIAKLSKSLPKELELKSKINSIRTADEPNGLPDNIQEKIFNWIDDHNSENLNKQDVSN